MSAELIETIREAHPRLSDNSPVSQSTLTRSVIQIADLAAEPTYPLREAFLRADVRALLAVPLLREERIIGAFMVRRRQTRFL